MESRKHDQGPATGRREFLRSAGLVAGGLCLAGVRPLVLAQEPQVPPGGSPDAVVQGRPGETILLSDMSRLEPQSAISRDEVKGRWRLLPYTSDGGGKGEILCVTQRDENAPESCLVPTVRLPLNLRGVYEIWVIQPRLARLADAGVDLRLSGDATFRHVTPWDVSGYRGSAPHREDCMVETFWRLAELEGQALEIRQPFGSFHSDPWGFCEAWFAGLRLVRVSPPEAERRHQEWEDTNVKRVVYNHDGHDAFYNYGLACLADLWRLVDVFAHQSVHHVDWCVVGGGGFNHATKVGEAFADLPDEAGPDRGGKRAIASFRRLRQQGIDPLQAVTERGRQVGVPVYASYRMNYFFTQPHAAMFNGPFWRAHPELRIRSGWLPEGMTNLDYALPGTQDYVLSVFRELLDNYDLDGVNMDFTRHPPFFNDDEPDKSTHMTAFVRALRQEVERASTRRGRRLALSVTFYASHVVYPPASKRPLARGDDGLDVAAWVREGLVDEIAPELVQMESTAMLDPRPYAELVRGTACEFYLRVENIVEHRRRGGRGPKEYEQIMRDATATGARGIYVYNNYMGTMSLRRLGFLDELRQAPTGPGGYGVIEGPAIVVNL
jgi:hypothetical protein